MALHAGIVDLRALTSYVEASAGTKGIKRLRRAVGFAEPRSESPMETRLRLQLIKARLPRPEVQVDLYDDSRRFLARADPYYPDVRLVIEFDGQNHRDRLVPDLRRQNALVNAGYHILRFTAPDVLTHSAVAFQVRRARLALIRESR
jgi:very-short-patch-repair endonuclease